MVTKKSMLLVGTESLEIKKMMYGKKKKMMCGGKAHREKKMAGGKMSSQPMNKEVMPKCMPN